MSSKPLAASGLTQARMLYKPTMHASVRRRWGMGQLAARSPLISHVAPKPVLCASGSDSASVSQSWKHHKYVKVHSGREMALCKPVFTHPELTQGIRLLTNILSEEACERLRRALPPSIGSRVQTIKVSSLGDAAHVVEKCQSRVIQAIENLYSGRFKFRSRRLRLQPAGNAGLWHRDDDQHPYRRRVSVRVPRHSVTSYASFRIWDTKKPEYHLSIEPGQAYIMFRRIGILGSRFEHSNKKFDGLSIILDFVDA